MNEKIAGVLERIRGAFGMNENIIMAFIGGSELHGAKLEGTDDTDLYGVYIEPDDVALGLDRREHFVWSSSSDKRRNTAADTDVTLYSLRKWAGLAVKGNPTCLHFLFWKDGGEVFHPAWDFVKEHRDLFLSKASVRQFLGFADAQLKRMTGEKGLGRHGQRPELEATYGFDTKAAFHVVRLLRECMEFVATGEITLPRPAEELKELIEIRRGVRSEDWVIGHSRKLFAECHEAASRSRLPDHPDREKVSKLLRHCYRGYWEDCDRSASMQQFLKQVLS